MGELAPPLAAVASEAHEGTVSFPDALLVAEPAHADDEVEFELLALDGGAHGSGILVAELGHPCACLSPCRGWFLARQREGIGWVPGAAQSVGHPVSLSGPLETSTCPGRLRLRLAAVRYLDGGNG